MILRLNTEQAAVLDQILVMASDDALDRAMDVMMLESFLGMLGIKPPKD